jgi:SAM-dependent methyltransferase
MNNNFNPLCSDSRYVPSFPNPEMSLEAKELWNYFSTTLEWGESIHSRATFDFLINAKEFAKGDVILDAGAGHQRYKPFFNTSVYLSQEHPAGIIFKGMQGILYDLISPLDEKIPLKDNSISTIINTSVIEHIKNPQKFFLEAHRVLKKGGRFYIHVPFTYSEHEVPFDFQRPTRYGLENWMKTSGFSKISILPSSTNFYGSSSFILHSMQKDLLERGFASRFNDIAPVLKYFIDLINSSTDDFINTASDIPIGWLAIAEKDGELIKPDQSIFKEAILKEISS